MKKFFILIFLVALVILIGIYIDILSIEEGEKLNLEEVKEVLLPHRGKFGERDVKLIELGECKKIIKDHDWIIRDCKEGIYFKIFFDEELLDPGQIAYLGFCHSGRLETFLKIVPFFNLSCMNISIKKLPIPQGMEEIYEKLNLSLYSICEEVVLFQDECIISIRGKV